MLLTMQSIFRCLLIFFIRIQLNTLGMPVKKSQSANCNLIYLVCFEFLFKPKPRALQVQPSMREPQYLQSPAGRIRKCHNTFRAWQILKIGNDSRVWTGRVQQGAFKNSASGWKVWEPPLLKISSLFCISASRAQKGPSTRHIKTPWVI